MNALLGLYAMEAAVILALAASLLGCARPSSADPGQSVAYYRTHAEERTRALRNCANDPGRLKNTPACVNARAAERADGVGSLRELPPMGLPQSRPRTTSHVKENRREVRP